MHAGGGNRCRRPAASGRSTSRLSSGLRRLRVRRTGRTRSRVRRRTTSPCRRARSIARRRTARGSPSNSVAFRRPDVAEHARDAGRAGTPRQDLERRGIRVRDHVGLLHARESVDRRAVEPTPSRQRLRQLLDRDRERLQLNPSMSVNHSRTNRISRSSAGSGRTRERLRPSVLPVGAVRPLRRRPDVGRAGFPVGFDSLLRARLRGCTPRAQTTSRNFTTRNGAETPAAYGVRSDLNRGGEP